MKIAVQLDEDRNILNVNNTSEYGSELQVKLGDKGWILVDNNPTFLASESYLWTIRELDNTLVHISTGMTPDEEKTQADALLGKNVGEALAKAQTADTRAENAVASAAQLGKLIAPLLATQTNSNTEVGGNK